MDILSPLNDVSVVKIFLLTINSRFFILANLDLKIEILGIFIERSSIFSKKQDENTILLTPAPLFHLIGLLNFKAFTLLKLTESTLSPLELNKPILVPNNAVYLYSPYIAPLEVWNI